MARELYVDISECTGCEWCADDLPDVFEMNPEGVSRVRNPEGSSEDRIQHVIDNCPAECIHWK
ncbi:MAG: ferredoxin [Spirochaetes bacterium]|nr:ferredoxin [Spirochaetota bacterium]